MTTTLAEPTTGTVEVLAAVTGVRDDVGDVIEPGAFRRTLAERRPKVCLGHDWNRPIGRVLDIKELMPGDPRLPKTTFGGQPWPKEAGAVWARMQINLDSDDGRAAFSAAKFFGPEESTYSIGYRTKRATQRGGTRHISDLDLFEFGPVLHPANRHARLLAVKGNNASNLEVKVVPLRAGRSSGRLTTLSWSDMAALEELKAALAESPETVLDDALESDAVWVQAADGSLSRATCAVCRKPISRASGGMRLGAATFYCPSHALATGGAA